METTAHVFSFSAYLSHSWRAFQTRRFNRRIAAKTANNPSSSILCLPDDILLMIFDLLQEVDRQAAIEWRTAIITNCEWDQSSEGWRSHIRRPHGPKYLDGDFTRFSMSNRRTRRLAEPRLFRTICMGSSWSAERASMALQTLEGSASAKQYTRGLELDVWAGHEVETAATAKKLLKLGRHFVHTMGALQNVQKLTLTVPASTALALHGAFQVAGIEEQRTELPNVKELVISPFMHWIIDFCPNVRSIESNDWVVYGISRIDLVEAMIEAAGKARCLEHLSLHCRWRIVLLERLVLKLPHLKSLAMRGGRYSEDMNRMLTVLKRHRSLIRLEMPDADTVRKVLHRVDSYSILDVPISWRYLEAKYEKDQDVSSEVLRELDMLQELCLGGNFQARVVDREGKEN